MYGRDRFVSRHGLTLGMAFAATYFVWGTSFLVTSIALREVPPLMLVGVRSLLGALVLIAWQSGRPKSGPDESRPLSKPALIGAGLLLVAGGHGLLAIAQQHVPSSVAATMMATIPLWLAMLSALYDRRRVGARDLAGATLGLISVIVLSPAGSDAHGVRSIGDLGLLVLSALSWALGSLISSRVLQGSDPIRRNWLQLAIGAAGCLFLSAALGEWSRIDLSQISMSTIAAIAYLGILSSALTYSAYLWLLVRTTPALASSYTFVNPIVAIAAGIALGGEMLTGRLLVAATLAIMAVVLLLSGRSSFTSLSKERGENAA